MKQDYRTQSPLVLYEGSVSDFVCPENELDVPNESLFLSDDDASDSETECHTLLLKDPHVLKQYDCRAAYHVCMQLRSCVEEAAENPPAKTSNVWPSEAKHMTVENVKRIVPVNLFNCIAWIVGATADYSTDDNFLDVNEDEERKILSICQDIMSLSHKGRTFLPKQYALGMAVRHLVNNTKIASILYGFCHAMSHKTTTQHDTGLAEKVLSGNRHVPEGFVKKTFATLVRDNNYFGEETPTGKGTTHNTNGIIVQRDGEGDRIVDDNCPLQGRRNTLSFVEEAIPDINIAKRTGPPQKIVLNHINVLSQIDPRGNTSHELNLAMTVSKMAQTGMDKSLPSWTDFNISITNEVPPQSKVGYLPVINSSPTLLKTVNAVFERSIQIADELGIPEIALVFIVKLIKK